MPKSRKAKSIFQHCHFSAVYPFDSASEEEEDLLPTSTGNVAILDKGSR